jgi:hypothetical protein
MAELQIADPAPRSAESTNAGVEDKGKGATRLAHCFADRAVESLSRFSRYGFAFLSGGPS